MQSASVSTQTPVSSIKEIWNPNDEALAAEFWQSKDKKGFSPVCANKFKKGCLIGKKTRPCSDCDAKEFVFINQQLLSNHINGKKRYGIYTPLKNDIVYWVAADIDGHTDNQKPDKDVRKLIEVCNAIGDIPLRIFSSNSGRGYHCYIFFKDQVPASKARILMLALTDRIEGDKEAVDCVFPKQDYFQGLSTGNLIALPWSGDAVKNRKSTLFLDQNTLQPYGNEIDIASNIEYFLDEFDTIDESEIDSLLQMMDINLKKPQLKKQSSPKKISENLNLKLIDECKFLQHCRDDAATLPEDHWYMMICILAREYKGPDIIHSLSQSYPKYSREETDAKILHALNDQPGPITCKTLKILWDCNKDCKVTCPIHLNNKNFRPYYAISTEKNNDTKNINIKEVIKKVKEDESPLALFDNVHLLAQLTKAEYGKIKTQLKQVLKKKLNLHDLNAAVKEASRTVAAPVVKNKSPLEILEGKLHRVVYKDGFPVLIPITSFTIKPIESINIPDEGEYLKVNLESKNLSRKIIFPPDCWISSTNFLKTLSRKEFYFTGNITDVQMIRGHLATFEMPHKFGVRTAGFHKGIFITENGGLTKEGKTDNMVYLNDVKTNCNLIDTKMIPANTDFSLLKKFNIPEVVIPVLGFATACFFKPQIMAVRKKFPLLSLEGEAGAGKTSTIREVVKRIWTISDGDSHATNEQTKFTCLKLLDSSNSIPVIFEENKATMLDDNQKKLMSSVIRNTYEGFAGDRGTENQSMITYRHKAPVIIVGETGFIESALLDRVIIVIMSKKDSSPHEDNFFGLEKLPLESIGRALLEKSLCTTNNEVQQLLIKESKLISSKLKDRPRTNAEICRFGLRMLGQILNMDFSEKDFKKIDNIVFEGISDDGVERKSTVDRILEGMCRMSAYAIISSPGKQNKHSDIKEYSYMDHLKEGVHYQLTKTELRLHIAGAFPVFVKWAKTHGFERDTIPESTFKKQLKKESYFIESSVTRIGEKTRRAFILNLDGMIQKGLEIGEEWNQFDNITN